MYLFSKTSFVLSLCLLLSRVDAHKKRQITSSGDVISEVVDVSAQGIPLEIAEPVPLVVVTVNDLLVSTNTTNATVSLAEEVSELAVAATSVSSTVLIIARDTASAYSATSGLNGYGIPYQIMTVPQAGADLPNLNSSTTVGNFGAIVILSEVSYDYGGSIGFRSALTDVQWTALYSYQTSFGARMVRIDVFPGPATGTTTNGGCCGDGVEQLISISDTTSFPTAGMKIGAGITTSGLWHYPATITDTSIAKEFAQFAPTTGFSTTTTAGVINTIDGRQQMVFFIGFATEWSVTSNYLQHAWIHWATRGLYTGYRRINLGTQIDDMFLESDIYYPANSPSFRIRTGDLDAHKTWIATINAALNPGSSYFVEIGHNGNGNIEAADELASSSSICGIGPIEYDEQIDTALEFMKPRGTGTNIWPAIPVAYPNYSQTCMNLDALKVWFATASNRDVFAHLSHTFTHEGLNNATYFDVNQEITWNKAWLAASGIAAATRFSNGLIPPAITGMHNGDAIEAWMTNGVTYVVGDNTRPVLMNTQNEHWPLISTVADNGYAGLVIIPRWATNIYYNCDTPECTVQEWIVTSAGTGPDMAALLKLETDNNIRHLMGLHRDPFMFHQANLRQTDAATSTIGGVTAKRSIFQMWVETITQEFTRLVNWPIVTLKHDDIGAEFVARMTRDACAPKLSWAINSAANTITGVTVTATGNTCSAKIPVTVPGAVTDSQGFTTEQIGNDPLTIWVTLSGSPVSFTLATPVAI